MSGLNSFDHLKQTEQPIGDGTQNTLSTTACTCVGGGRAGQTLVVVLSGTQ